MYNPCLGQENLRLTGDALPPPWLTSPASWIKTQRTRLLREKDCVGGLLTKGKGLGIRPPCPGSGSWPQSQTQFQSEHSCSWDVFGFLIMQLMGLLGSGVAVEVPIPSQEADKWRVISPGYIRACFSGPTCCRSPLGPHRAGFSHILGSQGCHVTGDVSLIWLISSNTSTGPRICLQLAQLLYLSLGDKFNISNFPLAEMLLSVEEISDSE